VSTARSVSVRCSLADTVVLNCGPQYAHCLVAVLTSVSFALRKDVNSNAETSARAHCGCLINSAPGPCAAISAGETPSVAAKSLDG